MIKKNTQSKHINQRLKSKWPHNLHSDKQNAASTPRHPPGVPPTSISLPKGNPLDFY